VLKVNAKLFENQTHHGTQQAKCVTCKFYWRHTYTKPRLSISIADTDLHSLFSCRRSTEYVLGLLIMLFCLFRRRWFNTVGCCDG